MCVCVMAWSRGARKTRGMDIDYSRSVESWMHTVCTVCNICACDGHVTRV